MRNRWHWSWLPVLAALALCCAVVVYLVVKVVAA